MPLYRAHLFLQYSVVSEASLCFQQNVPWPYKSLKSCVAQRNHENFEEVCSWLLASQLEVQSLLPGTQGTGVSKGEDLPRGPCHCQLLLRAASPSKCPPKPSQHCRAVARTVQTPVPSCWEQVAGLCRGGTSRVSAGTRRGTAACICCLMDWGRGGQTQFILAIAKTGEVTISILK